MHFLVASNYRLKDSAIRCVQSIEALGYRWTAFDLGGLGFGKPYFIHDQSFQRDGFYRTAYDRWPSRAMHKPKIIADFLEKADQLVVYLDADTVLRERIDEVEGDYDIGVTIRREKEIRNNKGRANAGVMFFNPTSNTQAFIEQWKEQTTVLGNDQAGLNHLLQRQCCRVREFQTDIYNWYYFPKNPPAEAKIVHFRISAHPTIGNIILPPSATDGAIDRT
jgi:hypothetical protein